jgi:hypothetical protein
MPTVLEAISPEAMRRQLAELSATDAQTQVLSHLLGQPDRLLMWAHTLGVGSNPSQRDAASPVPPHELRALDPGYTKSHWDTDMFTVLEYIPGGLRNWQDIVVLVRK